MADVAALLAIALVGAAYEIGRARWRAVAGRPMVSVGATTRFYAGLVVVGVAVASPLDIAADKSLPAHMAQHVLLLTLAAPLLASGLPMPTLLFALPGRARSRAIVHCRRFVRAHDRRYAAWVSGALILQAAVMWGWHVPVAYDAAVRNAALHACEHLSFLLVATLSWWSVATGPRHLRGAGAIAALIGSVPGMLLGAAMVLAPNPWYPIYEAGGRAHALVEQQVAGVIMWGFGGMAVVITGAALFAAWLAGPARDSPARIAALPTSLQPTATMRRVS
ncbi:MAG TPA: cytochrome c oxidase assembly protein [Acidimicrobiia bacterium]|jgi:cytochrome c oxidase assembly factor CtaG